jgi:hypothetical protein
MELVLLRDITIIKSVPTLKISKILDAQTNDGHLFIKQTKTISIPLININNYYKPLDVIF